MASWYGAPAAAPAPPADLQVQVPAGADTIQTLQFSPNSQYLVAGGWDNKVRLWEVARAPNGAPSGATPRVEADMGAPVLDATWKDDGSALFVVGCNKTVKLWTPSTNAVVDVGTHDAVIKHAVWCKDMSMLVTAGWDKVIKYWDPRVAGGVAGSVTLSERIYAMDAKSPALVAATADKKFHVFNMRQPQRAMREELSPLKFQSRAVSIFNDRSAFVLSSIEGRCCIRGTTPAWDAEKDSGGRPRGFAFKCHRVQNQLYSVNSLDCHPHPEFVHVFASAGGDGMFNFWNKDGRQRVRDIKPFGEGACLTAGRWNATGDLYAFAAGYDWSKGAEHFNPQAQPVRLGIHHTVPDTDLRQKPR